MLSEYQRGLHYMLVYLCATGYFKILRGKNECRIESAGICAGEMKV